ncbi:MAG: FAD-dependent oxidoreductase [Desulfarculus sp.]|nr:MAG: FAD-dependent oxidoreductase [Desulfarculus sp.]
MLRDAPSLANGHYDLVIVGGGAYGAAAAWEASLRGLAVALLEQGDFASATSANSLKLIHGGFRYLQSMDLARVRLSLNELAILCRIAPHLVAPQPCLLPTRGLGKQGRLALAAALGLYNLLNQHDNLRGRLVSRREVAQMFPACSLPGASGGALWHDGLVHDSERLPLSYALGAAQRGAVAANYVQATGLLREGGRVAGVTARDRLSGDEFAVRGRVVMLAAGPWDGQVAGQKWPQPALAAALNLVVNRDLCRSTVALRSPLGRMEDPVCGGHRFIFMVPWRGRTLLGTAYRLYLGQPGQDGPKAPEILALLHEFNQACPELGLTPDEICFYHWGLLPLAQPGRTPAGGGLAVKRRIDEQPGLILVTGAKYTTARAVACEAVDRVCGQLGRPQRAQLSAKEPVWGGAPVSDVELASLPAASAAHLRAQYGGQAGAVAALAQGRAGLLEPLAPDTPVLGCEVVQAVEYEMAQSLRDVSLRRTVLGKAGRPSDQALRAACAIMAPRLGWDQARQERELAQALAPYRILQELK